MSEQEPITVSQLVAANLRRLRRERGWTQAEFADRITFQSGEKWDNTTVSKAERSRRQLTPDELVSMARTFDVSLLDLFVAGDEVLVNVGGSAVRGGDFFRIAFMMPASYRWSVGESFYAGKSGRGDPNSELHRRAQIVQEAVVAVFDVGEIRERFQGVDQLDADQLADLLAEREEEIARWILERYGRETLRSLVDSDRMADLIEEIYPGSKAERQRRQEQ